MMAVETSQALKLRIPKKVYAWLEKESQRLDQPIDDLASVLIEEAMRIAAEQVDAGEPSGPPVVSVG